MTLPDLPQKKKKREATFTTNKVKKWVEKNLRPPAIIEVKQTEKDYISFREIRPRQRFWLRQAMSPEGKCYKVSDSAIGDRLPDLVFVGMMDAWVIIKYPTGVAVIGADHLLEEEKRSERKSLTDKRARKIADYWQ